jgi:hypothetical protein
MKEHLKQLNDIKDQAGDVMYWELKRNNSLALGLMSLIDQLLEDMNSQATETSPWFDNSKQFPRVIEEAQAAGAFTEEVIAEMCDSMDLEPAEIQELLARAMHEWEKAKEAL